MPPDEQARIARAKWEGEMERALRDADNQITHLGRSIDRIEGQIGTLREELASLKTKTAMYSAVGSLGGSGIVLFIVTVATGALQ